jgi:hypothetical protein
MLLDLCKGCLRFHPDPVKLAKTVAENLLERIAYVHGYFAGKFPREAAAGKDEKHSDMSKASTKIYKERR